jgi:hypothetical protein
MFTRRAAQFSVTNRPQAINKKTITSSFSCAAIGDGVEILGITAGPDQA